VKAGFPPAGVALVAGRFLVFLVLAGLMACSPRTFPDIQVSRLDGAPFQTAELRGRAAWLEFWSPWDPASLQRLQDLPGIVEKTPDLRSRVALIAVVLAGTSDETRTVPAGPLRPPLHGRARLRSPEREPGHPGGSDHDLGSSRRPVATGPPGLCGTRTAGARGCVPDRRGSASCAPLKEMTPSSPRER